MLGVLTRMGYGSYMEPGDGTAGKPAGNTEKEWNQPKWKHPYAIYIAATVTLFGFLLLMGYLAIENEWIPKR
jgi:hypothetical protein